VRYSEILQSTFQDLGFDLRDLGEITCSVRDKLGLGSDDVAEAVALMMAVQELDKVGFTTTITQHFGEAAVAASNAAAEARKAHDALWSIPVEVRSEFKIEGMLASAERWALLAAELEKIADLLPPRKRSGRPRNVGFRALVLLLAGRYHRRTGATPTVSYDAIKEVYRGTFIDWVEAVFAAGILVGKDWGYAHPSIWPSSPGARGRAIGRLLRDVTF